MIKPNQASDGNPFPGLRPFSEEEEHLFFGRETQVDTMIDKLAETHFLAVVGTSGSGKSSLVNCGLRPALHRGLMAKAGTVWRVAQFRPGSHPIRAMAEALAAAGALDFGAPEGRFDLADIIESTLRLSKLGLADVYEQGRLVPGTNLLVVADQFEELFRYGRLSARQAGEEYGAADDATAFVNLLLEAREHPELPIYVVLTMRSDFLGDCAQFFGLPEAINRSQYLVPRLTRDERRSAIAGPIGVGGAQITPVLLTRLVNDVGDNPDQLSILQHALNRTWAGWEEQTHRQGPIDLPHYEAIGTMANALDQHAERAYGELETERKQQICEKMFKALTDKSTDPRGIRRPTQMDTLCALTGGSREEIAEVIDVFRRPSRSFLMPPAGEPLRDETVIDISHESLMRVWERLKQWGDEEARSAQVYRRLAETAELYASGKANLWRNPDLRLALAWFDQNQPNSVWASRYRNGFESAIQFLRESKAAFDEQKAAERIRKEREANLVAAQQRSRRLYILFGIVAAAVILIAIVFVYLWRDADKQRAKAEEATRIAVKASVEAEEAKRVAEERTSALLKQFGWDSANLKKAGVDQYSVQQSLTANLEIQQASRKASPEARREVTVQYFPKDVDENKVESALMELGFTLDKRRAPLPGVPTNAIWYGTPVSVDDAKLVALTLVRAGVQIKAIRPFADYSPRRDAPLIQVGGDVALINAPPLSVDGIRKTPSAPSSFRIQ